MSSNKATTESSLSALQKTFDSLKKIQESLNPFLNLVSNKKYQQQHEQYDDDDNTTNNSKKQNDLYQITEAETAIALSIGTLRYIALRLKGNDSGKDDPLRMELDKMRKTLVELKKLKKKIIGKSSGSNSNKDDDDTNSKHDNNNNNSSPTKKRKSLDDKDGENTNNNVKSSSKSNKRAK